MKSPEKKHTFFFMNKTIKDGLQNIAQYNHTSLTHLLEEGAKMVIHRESMRIREDASNLNSINQMLRN